MAPKRNDEFHSDLNLCLADNQKSSKDQMTLIFKLGCSIKMQFI